MAGDLEVSFGYLLNFGTFEVFSLDFCHVFGLLECLES